MAITTAERRRSAGGAFLLPWLPSVTPNSAKDQEWRQQAGWTYSGIMVSFIAYVIEVDWNNDGDFSDANEGITGDVMAVECQRGRDYASQLTGRAVAGRCSVIVRNDDGKYSPLNTGSPLSGNIVPGRKLRVRIVGTATATIFTGFLDRILPEKFTAGSLALARIEASGPIAKLQGKRVSPAGSGGAATGTLVGNVLDNASWPAGDRSIDAGQTTTGRWFVKDKDALNAIRELEETEFGFFYEGLAWNLIYEDRHHRLKSDHLISQATYSDAAGAAIGYTGIREDDPWREIYNEIPAFVRNYTVQTLAVLWTYRESNPTLAAGVSKVFWAQYPNPDTATAGGVSVDAWTTPVVGTDITQTGVANGDIAVAVSKLPNAMKITVTNNHATATATLTLIQARGTAVVENEQTKVVSEDATSQTAYGIRTYRLPGIWFPNIAEAENLSDFLVSRYKDPLPLLNVDFRLKRSASQVASLLARAISDRITIVAANNAQLGINDTFFIEAISHRIRPGLDHEVSFALAQAVGDQGYWVLGTSTLGVSTKLAY